MTLRIEHIVKTFGSFTAVNDVSFDVKPGSIFGFLGTNGAGKTTTMRMILDIIRPDTGQITWNGTPTRDLKRAQFGYLPEERGLYPKMQVEDQLLFIGQLYGASKQDVQRRIDEWLERFHVTENRHKTVDQLSKGNQQKIQFLAAILHDPEILIMDEPYSGLDPVNAQQMKDAFQELVSQGKTLIFSTHQLNDAQELSSDVAIIHRGHLLISGSVDEVRQSTNEHYLRFAVAGDREMAWLDGIPDVHVVSRRSDLVEIGVPNEDAARGILRTAIDRDLPVTMFEIDYPSLNDVFLELVRQMPTELQPTAEELAVPASVIG
ncbi:MAG: ATP-binding cassette domain-containing protein [Thermomicrobiales bacterium]|nr:ATP-binding cassette domain-containing protein [Thermomicrobiales bacterium]